MEELRTKHKSMHNAAHHIGLDCIHPQDGLRHHATPNDSPILSRALCFTPRSSPVPGRVSHLSDRFQDSLTLTSDTDALVAKIGAMFPTVSETHIKILLKKYYNREAVVISALQVEKHPITTPGPLTMSPSASRLQKGALGVYSALQLAKGVSGSTQMTPSTNTPQGSPSLFRPASGASSYYGSPRSVDAATPKPHHSPKMKLRYLKSFFPKAEETLILDVLAGKDNNVQKASEELLALGFTRKDTTPAPKPKEKTPNPVKKVVHIVRTQEEKDLLKQKMQQKYQTIAPRVVSIALESVDFNEDRAEQILSAVLQEDMNAKSAKMSSKEIHSKALTEPTKRPRVVVFSGLEKSYKSSILISSNGPNPQLRKGPQDSLLLADYLTWNGPNPELRVGRTVKPKGVEPCIGLQMRSLARGPNPALVNGPSGLAKGSIYQKMNKKSVKICT